MKRLNIKYEKYHKAVKEERKMILEMINASWELAERLGERLLKNGCNCLACVNRRKHILEQPEGKRKFRL